MFLFLRLVLAHLIGDFPLQFNIIFSWKLKGFRYTIPHALIVTSCFAALSWPYLDRPQVWAFIVFLGAAHLVQDTLKVKLGSRFAFFAYVGDQLSHIGLIACMLLIPGLRDLEPPAGHGLAFDVYRSNLLMVYLCALIVATYNGYFLIRCFKDAYMARAHYNPYEKWYGIIERALIVSVCFAPRGLAFLLPVILIFRPVIAKTAGKRCGLDKDFASFSETLLSWAVALAAGLAAIYFKPVTL